MRHALPLLAALALTGCASLRPVPMPAQVPGDHETQVPVTFFPQEKYQCGPAALAMVLDWSGLRIEPSDLTESVYTPSRKGSLQPALVTGARRRGRVAYPIHGLDALATELEAGHPVIVLQNLSLPIWPRWHYAVVVGLDPDTDQVLLHSGLTPMRRMGLRTFMNTWRRGDTWGLLVLPPDELPATAHALQWVAAVSGLEDAGQSKAALIGYRTALARWPDYVPAWMGLGNVRYGLGELVEAKAAYRQAVTLDPAYALGWNNLAQALADLGERDAALKAARRAVSLGGPYLDEFKATLAGIEAAE